MKTQADLYEAAAKVLRMCEGTEVKINQCIKIDGRFKTQFLPVFDLSPSKYEFAIAIVEGKPVFAGDELYCKNGFKHKILSIDESDGTLFAGENDGYFTIDFLSWNPPKPKTVMVELLREDAEYLASKQCVFLSIEGYRAQKTIQKALES